MLDVAGDAKGAGAVYRDVLRRYPKTSAAARAHLMLGRQAAAGGRGDEAKASFTAALALSGSISAADLKREIERQLALLETP